MKNFKKYFIIILVISFLVMFFSFRAQYHEIIETFSNINYSWFFLAVLLMIIFQLIDAYFIIYYCRRLNKKYTIWQGIKVQQVGTFLNSVTPASSGGQFGQALLLSKQGINTKQSASMLMLSFISWQTVLVSFSLIALMFNFKHLSANYSGFFNLVFVGFAIDFIVIISLFLGAFSKKFHYFIFTYAIPFLGKIKILKNIEQKKQSTREWLTLFRSEFIFMLKHHDIMFRRLAIDITKITIFYSITFFSAKALNVPIGFDKFIILLILSSFVKMITTLFPTPGSSGGTEGVFVLLFGPILGAATTSVMLLWRLITYFIPMFISFIIFANVDEIKDMTKEEKE